MTTREEALVNLLIHSLNHCMWPGDPSRLHRSLAQQLAPVIEQFYADQIYTAAQDLGAEKLLVSEIYEQVLQLNAEIQSEMAARTNEIIESIAARRRTDTTKVVSHVSASDPHT